MKKYIYLSEGIYNEKNPSNKAIVLQYDSNEKTLTVIDRINKDQVSIGASNSDIEEALANYVSKEELESTKEDFVEKIKGFFKIQGTCTIEELSTKDKVEGHWWQVGDKEYVYNGTDWVEVGFEINLEESDPKFAAASGTFATKEEIPVVPTKISELENDSNFISSFTETDPVFAAQSGQFALKSELFDGDYNSLSNKPEIPEIPSGVAVFANDAGYLTEHQDISTKANIEDVYTKAQADSKFLTEHQPLSGYATKEEIPTKVSDLTNDSGFISSFTEEDPVYAAQSGQFALKSEIPTIPTNISVFTNDAGYLTEHQDIAGKADLSGVYSKQEADNKFLIEHQSLDNYATKAEIADLISEEIDPKFAEVSGQFQLASEAFDGDYNSLSNKPEIPVIPSSISTFTNDAGYLTEHQDISNKANINDINYLITKLSKVIKEVDALKHEANVTINAYNPQLLKANDGVLTIADTNVDAIVTSEEIEGKTTLNVKSIEIDNSSVDIEETTGTLFNINAKEDVSITNTAFSSDTIDSSVDLIYLTSAEVFKLDGVTFSGRTYNTIMTGQGTSGKYLKYADIVNCNFNEFAQHFNIWFAGWQDNAVLNIKNCKFARCEQFLCLGDYHGEINQFNNKLTINIENCEIEEYEVGETDQYSGIILCDSRNTTTTSQFDELNPFGNGKVIINIKNVTVGGVKLTKDNFLMGTKNGEQMLYVYQAATGSYKNISFNSDTKQFFPTVYVDGELITQLA